MNLVLALLLAKQISRGHRTRARTETAGTETTTQFKQECLYVVEERGLEITFRIAGVMLRVFF